MIKRTKFAGEILVVSLLVTASILLIGSDDAQEDGRNTSSVVLGAASVLDGYRVTSLDDVTAAMREYAETGFNQAVIRMSGDQTRDSWILKECEADSIKLVAWLPSGYYGGSDDSLAKPLEYLTRSTAFTGLIMKDEPSAADFKELAGIKNACETIMPAGKFAIANLFPNYATTEQLGVSSYEQYVSEYVRIVRPKVLCYDHYPITRAVRNSRSSKDLFRFMSNLSVIRQAAYRAKIPFWNVIQSWGYLDKPAPNLFEYRWMMNMTFALGGRGVIAFPYRNTYDEGEGPEKWKDAPIASDGKRTFEYNVVKQCNFEMHAFDEAFSQFENVGVFLYHPPRYVLDALKGDYVRTDYSPLKNISGNGSVVVGCMDSKDGKGLYVANASFGKGADVRIDIYGSRQFEIWGKTGLEQRGLGNKVNVKLERGEAKFIRFNDQSRLKLEKF
ncbi:MAG TPA: hypothetical protein VIS48_14975 [Candidatus Kryptonia bacterium]